MNILVVGGTLFMGVHLVNELLAQGHTVTIATRGKRKDPFGNKVNRIIIERESRESIATAFRGKPCAVVYDTLAYCSDDIRILLDEISLTRYIMVSTMSVYEPLGENLLETDFNPLEHKLLWCKYEDFPYAEVKRQAEAALYQKYSNIPSVAVRFPYVIGMDDYTKRLLFYIENTIQQVPMYIDNLSASLAFIRSNDAGKFLADILHTNYNGPMNACNPGVVTIQQILDFVTSRTGLSPVLSEKGEPAPYNSTPSYSLSTQKAKDIGIQPPPLSTYFTSLLGELIESVQ